MPDRLAEEADRLAHHAFHGEMWDKAVRYYQEAGATAVARSGNREAVEYYEQALAALTHLPKRRDTIEQSIDLRLDLKHPLELLGELQRLFDHLREAETLATALNDRRRLGRVSAYMSDYRCFTGYPDEALEFGQRTAAIAEELEDISLQLVANFHLGQAHHASGNYSQAIGAFRANVELTTGELLDEPVDPAGPDSIVIALTLLAWCQAECGDFALAIESGETAVRTAESSKRSSRLAAASFGLGIVHLRQGSLQKAISVLEESLELIRAWDLAVWFAPAASSLGSAYLLSGRVSEALPLLEQAVEQDAVMGIMVWHALVVASLGEGYLRAGRLDDAIRSATRALHLSHAHKERGHSAWVLRLLGEIAMHRDPADIHQAEGYYRQGLSLADELGMRPLTARCHHGLGGIYGQTRDSEQARNELSTAIEMYRDMEMPFWQSAAEAALIDVRAR